MADDPEEIEARWAEIVAQLQRESDPDRQDSASATSDGGVADGGVADGGAADRLAGDPTAGDSLAEGPAAGMPASGRHGGVDDSLDALFEPLRRALPEPHPGADPQGRPGGVPEAQQEPDTWSDEGHFVPPPPPELPEGTPVTRLAWAGTLGGPAVMLGSAMLGWDAPRVVMIGAGLAFLAGFVTLVWQLPDSREDGWDDGATL